jgi:predicted GNAT family acetyltransferase
MLLLQAPDNPADVARAALKASGRPLTGLAGPYDQVLEAGRALGLKPSRLTEKEGLYALDVSSLLRPAGLQTLRARHTRDADLALCSQWRIAYLHETGLAASGADVSEQARSVVALAHGQDNSFVLEDPKQALVAYSAFNARLPDMVQIGGVWTPPHLRGQGYARCIVAGSLLVAQPKRAILFTPDSNAPAIRAYLSLGFRRVGDYGLLIRAP